MVYMDSMYINNTLVSNAAAYTVIAIWGKFNVLEKFDFIMCSKIMKIYGRTNGYVIEARMKAV